MSFISIYLPPEQMDKDTVVVPVSWECCEYCLGRVKLIEDVSYELAHCPVCGIKHAWSDEDARWFGL